MASQQFPKKAYFCGHCSKELSKTLYFQHRKLFYKKPKKGSERKVFENKLGPDFYFGGVYDKQLVYS